MNGEPDPRAAHEPPGRPPVVTATETALERELSQLTMRGGPEPAVRRLPAGTVLARQGESGEELYVLLDGVVAVDRNDERLAELGPGAVLGERAVLEGGVRTATLTAVTRVRVAVVGADTVDPAALARSSIAEALSGSCQSTTHRRAPTVIGRDRAPLPLDAGSGPGDGHYGAVNGRVVAALAGSLVVSPGWVGCLANYQVAPPFPLGGSA